MASIIIEPARLSGRVRVPPSKSIAHRAVICAALSAGLSSVRNIELSDDLRATVGAMEVFGASCEAKGSVLSLRGLDAGMRTHSAAERVVACGESGSTLRFLIPIALALGGKTTFTGGKRLGERPLDAYSELFTAQGIDISCRSPGLDMTVCGKLSPGRFSLRGDVSSQFVTGLLLALPLLDGDSEIILTTDPESERYIDLTLSVMEAFGVAAEKRGRRQFFVKGGKSYKSRFFTVEGDYSQAAFFLAAGALGCRVEAAGLNPDSLQGDRAVVAILKRMGAEISFSGDTAGAFAARPTGAQIDASQCPDIIPPLAAVAALARGTTEISRAGRLRLKESDRLYALAHEFSKLGAVVEEKPDGLLISGVSRLKGGAEVWSHNDHRIAMALAVASVGCAAPFVLKDYECVSKSYPGFFGDFAMLGGCFHEQ